MTQHPSSPAGTRETLVFDRITGISHARDLFEKNLYRETFSENRREESVKLPMLRKGAPLSTHP